MRTLRRLQLAPLTIFFTLVFGLLSLGFCLSWNVFFGIDGDDPRIIEVGRGRLQDITFLSKEPRIILHRNFLSPLECEHIISLAANEVQRSGTTGEDGKIVYSDYRTSHGAWMSRHHDDPVLMTLADRIEKWTMLPKDYGETFYVLRYDIGQEYKAHTDWFAAGPQGLGFLGYPGNRLATVIVYLTDVEEGGETLFPTIGLKIRPQRGTALLFWNRMPDGTLDPDVLHSSAPVIRGQKWSISRWIRERSMRPKE